jgi:hypothetical protein
MWVDKNGSNYGGACKPGDRMAPHAEIRDWHRELREGAITSFGSPPKPIRALLLAIAALAGQTAQEVEEAEDAEDAFDAAIEAV